MVYNNRMSSKRSERTKGQRPLSGGPRYPWVRWFRRPCFTLRRGHHYHGRTYIMVQQVRNAAVRYRKRVRIIIADDEQSFHVSVLSTPRYQGELFDL